MPIDEQNINNMDMEPLINDMVGILLQYSSHGHFITNVLELWQISDPHNKSDVRGFLVKIINRYKLDAEYLKILQENPDAAKISTQYLMESSGMTESVTQKISRMLNLPNPPYP